VEKALDLDKFFNPRSIAIIGVSRNTFSLGGLSYLTYLQESRFAGPLYPINPSAEEILGIKAYAGLTGLPRVPDLAIVCVAANRVPSVLEECARVGVTHIHILTAGFSETGTKEGKTLEEEIAAIARKAGLLIMGPNCMGPYCPSARLTAWGARPGLDGPLGVISQSGGITQRLTEYACSLGVGVHKAASIGNATVLDSTDYLMYMARDEKIRVIAMYLESVRDGKRLLKLARQVNRDKPIVFLKGGESERGASTVISHTGRMAGGEKAWQGFMGQSGVSQVRTMNEWMDAILAFCLLPAPRGRGVFLVGGGGGNSVIYSDTCIREGLEVPALSKANMKRLRPLVPMAGSIAGNPLDLWETFQNPARLSEILEMGYEDPQIHMIIVDRLIPRKAYHMPIMPDSTPQVVEYLKSHGHRKPTVFNVDSEGGDQDLALKGTALRTFFCQSGIPAFPSLERAARALFHLYRYHSRFSLPENS